MSTLGCLLLDENYINKLPPYLMIIDKGPSFKNHSFFIGSTRTGKSQLFSQNVYFGVTSKGKTKFNEIK